MGFIAGAWRGEEKLWKVFWIYGVLFGYAVGYIFLNADGLGGLIGITVPPKAVIAFCLFIYPLWLMVAEWRSAYNTDWRFLGYFVRLMVIFNAITLLFVFAAVTGLDTRFLGINLTTSAQQCSGALQAYQSNGGKDVYGFMSKCMVHKLQMSRVSTADIPGISSLLNLKLGSVSDEEKFRQICVHDMVTYAEKMGLEPQQYVSGNLAYVEQCVQYHMGEDAAKSR